MKPERTNRSKRTWRSRRTRRANRASGIAAAAAAAVALASVLLLGAVPGLGAMAAQEQVGAASAESTAAASAEVEGGAATAGGALSAAGVIATTAWTAAFVQLAGAENPRVLAPYEMRHPPEYELKPSDIQAVAQARLIVFAGYETMVEKLKETAGRNDIETLQIDTRNDLATIRPAVEKIARALGTEGAAAENLAELEGTFADWRREIAALGLEGAPVLVHFFQQPLARQLGFEVKGVFGPGPLEPAQIVGLSGEKAVLIIDNWHNELSRPLTETIPGALKVSWLNFPGAFDSRSLGDVLDYNRRALVRAAGGQR